MYKFTKSRDEHQQYLYKHFNQRLRERYNLTLTEEKYRSIYHEEFKILFRLTQYKTYGIIKIKGKDVYVIRDTKYQRFSTCLNPDGKLPVPKEARSLQLSSEEFREDIEWMTNFIKDVGQQLNTLTKKEFFNQAEYPFWVYTSAYKGIYHDCFLQHLVKSMYSNPTQEMIMKRNIVQQLPLTTKNGR